MVVCVRTTSSSGNACPNCGASLALMVAIGIGSDSFAAHLYEVVARSFLAVAAMHLADATIGRPRADAATRSAGAGQGRALPWRSRCSD